MKSLLPFAATMFVVASTGVARAQQAPLPPDVIGLDTAEGEKLLSESDSKSDFAKLVSTFVTQERSSYCGVASAVAVLNALPIKLPDSDGPGPMFTQKNFFATETAKLMSADEAARGGMTLAQLGNLLQTHPVNVEIVYASDISLDEMRARLSKNVATPTDFAIVNYSRGELAQESMGHISPLGAYHAGSDRFLVLDVARYKYPPQWVKAEALHRAMRSGDIVSGKSRGFAVVTAAKAPPGSRFLAPARRPVMLLGGIITAAFFVGLGVGLLIGNARGKRVRTASPEAN
jgi:hypothetical protein